MTRDRDAWQSWLVSGVVWISLLSLLLGIGMHSGTEAAGVDVSLQASRAGEVSAGSDERHVAPATDADPPPVGSTPAAMAPDHAPAPASPPADSASRVAPGDETVASAESSPAARIPPSPATQPSPEPAHQAAPVDPARQRHTLQAVESSVDGKTLRVLLRMSHSPVTFTRFESKAASGHVLDLPGRWQFVDGMKMLHAFPESNLQQIRFGLHKKFLRVVLTLRRPDDGAQPQITATADGVLIEIDG